MSSLSRRSRPGRGRLPLTIAAVIGVAALLAACTPGSTTSNTARESSLVIAENEVPATFDPVQADNSTVDEVVIPAYNSLLTYDENIELTGELVDSWTVSEDGTKIDLTLRDDVTFHDGAPLTADDVVYTLDRISDIGIGVAAFLTAYASSEAISETEVSITLSQPDAPFLAALTRVYVLNSALVSEHEGSDSGQSWLASNDAGSGPYELAEYSANQSARFTQYPDYWGGFDGQAETIEFRYLTEASTQSSALTNGDVDIAMDITPREWATFESNEGFTVDKADSNVVLYVFFNMDDPVTSNPALREAISHAYDYDQHVESILVGAGQTVNGVVPAGMQCVADDLEVPTFDLDRATQIIDENGLEGTTVTMTYLEATAEMEQAAALLQSNLAEIGVNLELQAITYPQYVELSSKPETRPQLGMIYAFPAFPDTSAILYQNFNSSMIGSQNWGGYSNPRVDELTNAAQVTSDQELRCEQYEEVQHLVTDDIASVNLANAQTVAVFNDRVQGFKYRSWHHQTVDVYAITLAE
ncbi:ABC transporter substrate-binding protein [Agromyces aerolatus]|uniref:ABC transporter substrate-binding protein n=1 Tax=Agromyces sp. LY-1074 TaxID=3074080 RepID=UPI002864B0D5|nr:MULTISPECIES: ABC transporter substrate-binding protein [unclassified Agromyces]MDR5699036.1 ABC transporter substrate-binding protein [Agromyces sp. LY-1074]MDR5705186.1 ABC transporter substrate-binding protein [Agromyces sp. LY-1358]